MDDRFKVSTPEELNTMLKDEQFIKEFANYVIFEGMTNPQAWTKTFRVDSPMSDSHKTKMYRWLKKDQVQKWLTKANKSLEVDWIDKRVNALQHLYDIGTDGEALPKDKVAALDKFLTHLNKEENKIKLDIGNAQVNIVQIVQDKLSQITDGSTIQPDCLPSPKYRSKVDAIDVEVERVSNGS